MGKIMARLAASMGLTKSVFGVGGGGLEERGEERGERGERS
jgi:hypothetical protein